MSKISVHKLRTYIREALLNEEAWVPGRYYPGSEPLSNDDANRLNNQSSLDEEAVDDVEDIEEYIEEDLYEVDLDPSNNPGRPSDPYDYLGMHAKPGAALAHPSISGGVPSTSVTPDVSDV